MAAVTVIQTSPTGFTPYYSGAYLYATGALFAGAGGAWGGTAVSGIYEGFLVGMAQSATPLKPYIEHGDLSSLTFSELTGANTGTYIIGANDIRGTGVGYSGTVGMAAGHQPLSASESYYHGLYARITGTSKLGGPVYTGLVGIGTTFDGGWYTGIVTTDETIYNFSPTYNTGTQSGSGVRLGRDLSLSINFMDRAGNSVGESTDFAESPYLSGFDVDITTVPSSPVTVVRSGFITGSQDPVINFTEQDNIDTFGTYTRNFGIRTRLTDQNNLISTGHFLAYANDPKLESVQVRDYYGTFLDSNPVNFVSPQPNAPHAQDLASHYQVDTVGITGTINLRVTFPEGQRMSYDALHLYGATGQGNSFPLNPANFLQSYTLSDDTHQFFQISRNAVTADVAYYFGVVPYSSAGYSGQNFRFGPYTLRSVPLARDPILYKTVTNQKMKGCLDIQGCGLNIVGDGSAGATPPTLYVSGDSSGTGEGSRLTLNHVPYLLSGDAASSVTLQDVTDNGNTSTNDISVGTSITPTAPLTIKTDSSDDAGVDIYADGDTSNRILTLKADSNNAGEIIVKDTAGVDSVKLSNTSSKGQADFYDAGGTARMTMVVDGNNQGKLTLKDSAANTSIELSSDSDKRGNLGVYDAAGTLKAEIKADSNDEGIMSIKDSLGALSTKIQGHKAVMAAFDSNIYSTGSVIVAGSGHIISGDYDVIAGGAKNDISGCNFAFIGGGSGLCVSHSEYSSSIGGYDNDVDGASYSIIGGGYNNKITGGDGAFLGGGYDNLISGTAATVVGGVLNKITGGGWSFIGGGEENTVTSVHGSILGGEGNTVNGLNASIAGGYFNTASGNYAFVGGGEENRASGDYSYAFGRKAEIGKDQDGAAVLADGQNRTHSSSGLHTLTLDFASGVYVPATGFFNALHVSGVSVLTGENNPAEADTLQTVTTRGATTDQAISITNTSTSALAIATDALVVDGSNDRVGIGTASNISSKLDVLGNISVGAGGYYAGSTPAPTDGMIIKGTVGIGTTSPASASNLHVYGSGIFGTYTSAPTNGLAVEGNLGVGTYSPNTALDVRGTISGYTGLFHYKVGIGTDAPTEMLGITPNTDVSAEIGRAHVGYIGHSDYAGFSHIDRNSTTEYALLQQSNGATYLNAANATNIYFKMNNSTLGGFNSSTDFYVDTDTLYVDASEDRVGINESSPSYTLDVTASDDSSLLSRFYNSSSTNGQGLLLRAGETSNYNRILQCASRTDSKVMTVNSNGRVGIGTTEPTTTLEVIGDTNVDGHFAATSKSFLIDHPTKENKKLQYASLEGPEHGVFVRGTTNKNVIKLPDYWKDLVHEDSITVTLTPLHTFQSLYVKSKTPEQIVIGGVKKSYDYVVYAERKDIDKLEVEI
jgi:hypothetical protein